MMPAIELSEPDHGEDHGNQPVVGIDLGTTNSLIGAVEGGEVRMLADAAGRVVMPSAVYYGKDGAALAGNAAVYGARHPTRLLTSIKRLLGQDGEAFQAACASAGYEHERADGIDRIAVGDRLVTPVEASAEILRMLWTIATDHFGQEPGGCVITVPAYFDEKRRQAVRLAARLLGINVMRLLDEPTAAAIAYGLDHEKSRHVLVYDLGGGTFDVSVIRLHEGIFEVLATGGDDALGGDDFDSAVIECLRNTASAELDEIPLSSLRAKARRIKEALSSMSVVQIDLSEFGIDERIELDVDEYEKMVKPLVDRTLAITASALRDSGLATEELDRVILAGGATRLPLVSRMLAQSYEQEILDSIDPEQVVAYGASLHAAQLAGKLPNRHLLLGVLPLSLGIETMGGIVEIILPRNTTLPARQVQRFTTHQNNQTGMVFHIVQGEREMSADCRSLARFELNKLPTAPAGMLVVELSFEVDADGLLTARAREPESGAEVNVEVRPSSGLNEEQIHEMLRSSFEHAEDDHRTRLLGEQRLAAEQTLATIANLARRMDDLPSSFATEITTQSEALRVRLSGQDYESIQKELNALNRLNERLVQMVFEGKFHPKKGNGSGA